MDFNLERNILEDIDLGRVPAGVYDLEDGTGPFIEKLFANAYIDGKMRKGDALIVRGLTRLGKERLAELRANSGR